MGTTAGLSYVIALALIVGVIVAMLGVVWRRECDDAAAMLGWPDSDPADPELGDFVECPFCRSQCTRLRLKHIHVDRDEGTDFRNWRRHCQRCDRDFSHPLGKVADTRTAGSYAAEKLG